MFDMKFFPEFWQSYEETYLEMLPLKLNVNGVSAVKISIYDFKSL